MPNLNEREIIRIFSRRFGISGLDDVALVGKDTVLKCDMLVGSTDVPPKMKAWQVARKSIVSCASDLAAKGAEPLVAMVSLGIPGSHDRKFITDLAEGFARAAEEFGVRIVGGDTNKANDLVIDCCMLGRAGKHMPSRSGATKGDVVVVSGLFGLPAAGLAILLDGCSSEGRFAKRAVKSVLEPVPRQRFGTALARFFSSSIDSSDGLATSLYQLASDSRVDIVIDRVPSAAGVGTFARRNNLKANELVFHGGEEYEIVATLPERDLQRLSTTARRTGVVFFQIGRVKEGSGKVTLSGSRLEDRGYVHFQSR